MLNDTITLFIGETESKLGTLIGIAPLGSSIEMSLNLRQVRILLNKYQLKDLTENLIKILSSLEDNKENKDCDISDNTFIRR